MRSLAALPVLLLLISAWPAGSASAGNTSADSCQAANPMDIFCQNQGGCPQKGYCYFPDGSYRLSWSLYDEACRSCSRLGTSEQAAWRNNIYSYLYSVDCRSLMPYAAAVNLSSGSMNSS